jgi:hypothetical protein
MDRAQVLSVACATVHEVWLLLYCDPRHKEVVYMPLSSELSRAWIATVAVNHANRHVSSYISHDVSMMFHCH